jgi:CheY-like chemotaxis protein
LKGENHYLHLQIGGFMAHILIIDDEDQFRKMLRQMLERADYEVREAADGEQGLQLFRQQPVDLVITDIFMPEKEGIETIFELRRDFPDVKIIAISGGGRVGGLQYLKYAEGAGADHVLIKPFERRELLQAIQDVLGKQN